MNPLLHTAWGAQRPRWRRVTGLSLVISLLALVPSAFMYQVYGRVLDSGSATTLLWLLVLVIGSYAVMELLGWARARTLAHIGEGLALALRSRLVDASLRASLGSPKGSVGTQAVADLRTVSEFVASPAVVAVLDLPAALLCLGLLFIMAPWLGVLAVAAALLQGVLVILNHGQSLPLLAQAAKASMQADRFAQGVMQRAEMVAAMGMQSGVHAHWRSRHRLYVARQAQASDAAALHASLARLVQTAQASLMLGLACWLVLQEQLLGGAAMLMVASLLGSRALMPLAQLVALGRSLVNARDAWGRLQAVLQQAPLPAPGLRLPRPRGQLSVEALVVAPPGADRPMLKGLSFRLDSGEVLAVMGPSAAGKTVLARALLGLWPASSGVVRLDGADLHSWPKHEVGPHLGYLPQQVELLDGTVAENIARFSNVDMRWVREAADAVGISNWIERLPQGFDTPVGEAGVVVSGGQRQRLGLARAVYGWPSLLVLDEPNSNLDEAGEAALLGLLQTLKARGATVVAITHRRGLLPAADKLLLLAEGQLAAFGPRDDVLAVLKRMRSGRGQPLSGVTPAQDTEQMSAPAADGRLTLVQRVPQAAAMAGPVDVQRVAPGAGGAA